MGRWGLLIWMLTGADLDTKHSLDEALVQISLPSQTQTSRQIAWVNVIGVTSPPKKIKRKKEGEKNPRHAHHSKLQGVLVYIFPLLSWERWQKKKRRKQGAGIVSRAGFAKLQWSSLPIRSVSLAGVKLSEVCTARIMRKKPDKDTDRQRDKDTKWHRRIPAQTQRDDISSLWWGKERSSQRPAGILGPN